MIITDTGFFVALGNKKGISRTCGDQKRGRKHCAQNVTIAGRIPKRLIFCSVNQTDA